MLGGVPGVSRACRSSVGAVASFRGVPRPLAAVVLWVFVVDLLASGLALFTLAVLVAVVSYICSPMLDRFGRPEARISEVSGSPMLGVPPVLTFLRFAEETVALVAAGRFLGGMMPVNERTWILRD